MTNVSEYARICKDTHITDIGLTDFIIKDTKHNIQTNFDARLYCKNNEMVICFQASMEGDWGDNYRVLFGLLGIDSEITIPTQLKDALDLYFETKEKYPDYNITLTGHSFGGVLAQLVSYITGENCISFSTPGLQYATNIINSTFIDENYSDILQEYGISANTLAYSDQNIEDYSNMNDPIGNIVCRLGGVKRNPTSKRWEYKTELKNAA